MSTRGQRWLHDLDDDEPVETSGSATGPEADDQRRPAPTRRDRLDHLDPARRADLERRARDRYPAGAYVPRQILEITVCDLLDQEGQP